MAIKQMGNKKTVLEYLPKGEVKKRTWCEKNNLPNGDIVTDNNNVFA